jgi:GAF domain-containing protein
MEPRKRTWETNMKTDYGLMKMQLESLSQGVEWDITILSNASALLWDSLEDINWAGFYIMRNGRLELGPFQGKTACTLIETGKGVCGTAVSEDRTQLVPDVHLFPGHIACDSASNSEIVVPLHRNGEVYGVIDIDSPRKARFTEDDRRGLEAFAAALETIIG